MRFLLMFFLIISPIGLNLKAVERGSSAPYISGDTFRGNCDFTYDELSQNIKPFQVKSGSTIFVKADCLERFFRKIHPRIFCRYILVTHNSDCSVPGRFARFLDDEKIIAWFGQNIEDCDHPKMHPIPIGIANRCWSHGNTATFKAMQVIAPNIAKNTLLYMNFSIGTYIEERSKVADMFRDKPYCVISEPKEMNAYLTDLVQAKFVLSPHGHGLDCHRTWETLLMGAYPIVHTSSLDSMYENLPVVIVNDWKEVNEQFLQEKYEEFQTRIFQMEKIYIDYWLKEIKSYKK